jgi:hypothetical protein
MKSVAENTQQTGISDLGKTLRKQWFESREDGMMKTVLSITFKGAERT